MILTPLQKLPKNGGDWGKLIVAKGFKKLPKFQNIAQSGHTVDNYYLKCSSNTLLNRVQHLSRLPFRHNKFTTNV